VLRCPQAHFYLLGSDTNTGPQGASVRQELERRLKSSNCFNAVTFISKVQHTEVPAFMRAADMCVVPSLYDNLPFTCIEALASGKPVIGTSSGGMPECIIDGETGLIVPPKDADALAQAILKLANDKEKRERFGFAARRWAETNCAREIVAAEMLDVYREAQSKFKANRGHSLNRHELPRAIATADQLANSFDEAFHQLRLRWSMGYRVRTICRRAYVDLVEFLALAKQRPRLAAAQLVLAVFGPALRLLPGKGSTTLSNLEQTVRQKHEHIEPQQTPVGAVK
jgi:hypothetical protein